MTVASEIGISIGSVCFKTVDTQFFKLPHKTYNKLVPSPSLSISLLNQCKPLLISARNRVPKEMV